MLNVPATDNFALRGVVFHDTRAATSTTSMARGPRPTARGSVPPAPFAITAARQHDKRAGFQSDPATLASVNFLAADNSGLVQKNFNDVEYAGFRASALYEFSPDWKLTVSHTRQSVKSDGVFFADPSLGLDNLEIQRFEDDRLKDNFSNTAWTLEGRLAALDLVTPGPT